MPVTFRLTIQETPIAGAPIEINLETNNTDNNGEVRTRLIEGQSYTVSSGLPAIYFGQLFDTGASFSARSPVTIEATRLLNVVAAPCRLFTGGLPNIYFSCANSSDQVLTVPLQYSQLNSMLSPTGQAVPETSFGPGTSGFSILEEYFRQGESLAGVWKFLGTEVLLNASPLLCADTGVPESCTPLDPALLRGPFEHTRRVLLELFRLSVEAARRGKWKPTRGGVVDPFRARGAQVLAKMESLFSDSSAQNFECSIIPISCYERAVPKQKLIKEFTRIFDGKFTQALGGKIPKGLEGVFSRRDREVKTFKRLLKKLPNRYTNCG